MANITINTSGTEFLESAGNNGTIATHITVRLTDGTFAGDNGDVVAGVQYTGVPTGLSAVLVKTSGTTAKLSLTGHAGSHANGNDATALKLTLATASFATGTLGASTVEKTFTVDFRDAAQVGTLAMVAPTVAFGKTLPVLQGAATSTTSKVFIFNGTKQLGEAVVDANTGLWTFTPPAVKDGVFQLTAREQFAEKVFGTPTGTIVYTVDTKAPAAPTVTASRLPTSDSTPTVSGKAEKGASVEVFADGTSLGTTVAHAQTGTWSLTPTNAKMLADGIHQITATATDAAGNTSTSKKAVTLTVDTAIEVPAITSALKAVDKLVTQKLEGTAEAGATVQLYGGSDGATALGNPIKVDKYGKWKASVKLAEGTHILSVVATDVAGNSSANSAEKTITIDTFAPAAPTLVAPETLKLKALPATLTGTAEPGLTVLIYANTTKLGEATADVVTGVWTFDTTGSTVAAGVQRLSVKATDAAGNLSPASNVVAFTIDPNAPTFEVAVTSGELTFSGPATGNITVTTAEVEGKTIATFQRDGVTAATKPDLATVTTITLAEGQSLAAGVGNAVASKTFTGAGSVNMTGTAEADTLSFGTTGGNTLNGGAGDDTITGRSGNDTITGGTGVDTLDGGAGNDTFVYAAMADFVTGNVVVDAVTGGDGTADRIQVNAAIALAAGDDLAGAVTVEQLVAQTQSAAIRVHSIVQSTDAKLGSIRTIDLSGDGHASSTGAINLTGITGAIATTLMGVAGGRNDIRGGAGADTITGGSATDTLIGGDGVDVITGGAGNDILQGGVGADTFVFADTGANNGADSITDFTFGAGGDALDFGSFLTAAKFYDRTGDGTTIGEDGVAAASTGEIALFNIENQVVLLTTSDISTQAVTKAALFGSGRAFAAESDPIDLLNFVLLVGEADGTDGVRVYYVTDGTAANDMSITLVGTFSGVSLANVHADNLA